MKIRTKLGLSLSLLALSLVTPGATKAAGVSFLPGAVVSDIHPVRANLSVLTYTVPDGLLVADRVTPGHETRYGEAFTPRFKQSEFFLVQGKSHRHPTAETARRLATVGHVHWQSGDVFVAEVPLLNQARFASYDLDRTHIPLHSPPAGWDKRLNQPIAPTMPADKDLALVEDFVGNISEPAFFQTIQEISGFTDFSFNGLQSVSTRYYNTADKNLVADYLADILTGYGYTVEFDEFRLNRFTCRNIVATRIGTTTPDEYVVVGGHYDSISPTAATTAPGAEDNGSGTAAVMEIARIAAGREFERSVQFVLFDAEEQGLYGSSHFVAEATTAGREIVAAITMDMVGFYLSRYSVRIEGQTPWEWLMTTMADQVSAHTDISYQKDYFSWGSDHVPFQQAGIPAFLAIDYDYADYPAYHQSDDNWPQIAASAAIGTQITTAAAATLAEVAVLQPNNSAVANLPRSGPLKMAAYPNPFNPRVTFAFSPQQEADGQLAVYDLTGKRVAILVQGTFPAGLNQAGWDGQDQAGRAVSSGAYVCRLRTTAETISVLINLVR